MQESSDWLLYGASGYTGKLIAERAASQGLRPTLAGRSAASIEPLAARLKLPALVFELDDAAALAERLRPFRLVLNCAGPFSRTASAMMNACLAASTDYLDITGEIEVLEAAAALHAEAMHAGITLTPAVGFDVVPTDCLAVMLAQKLPGATILRLAFGGLSGVSPGTAKTMLEGFPRGGLVRREGKLEPVPAAAKTLDVPFHHGVKSAVLIPWGDLASAYRSTGIPNIETYMALPQKQIDGLRRIRKLLPLFGRGPLKWLAHQVIRWRIKGPAERERRLGRSSFWGEVSDEAGLRVSATMETASGYELTVLTALEAVRRVLAGDVPHGYRTPAQAFGADMILGVEGTELHEFRTSE